MDFSKTILGNAPALAADLSLPAASKTKPSEYPSKLFQSEISSQTSRTTLLTLSIFINVICDVIKDKKFSAYDFYEKLVSNRGKVYRLPGELKADGVNLLFLCLQHGRYSFLQILVYLGWFSQMSKETVSNHHPCLFAPSINRLS